MKTLKLFLAFAILSLSLVNSSLLKAADEEETAFNDPIIMVEEPEKKGFFRSLLFWKSDETLEPENFDEITDEELDPRLKRERAKPIDIRIRDKYSIKVDILKLFETNLKETNNLNKDTEFVVPLDEIEREIYIEEYYDREAPLVMSHLDIKQSVDSYKEKYFAGFSSMGRIKLIHKDISEAEVKGYGAYIGANLIIMQKFFEPTVGKYIYDIMFLSGDVKNKEIYWIRNSSEAEPLNKTLEALNISNLNDYMNIITHDLLNPNRKIAQKISANYELEKEKERIAEEEAFSARNATTGATPGQTVDRRLETIVQRANQSLQNQTQPVENPNDNSSYLLNDLSEEELYELQKALITFRVNAVVGYWEDAITGEAIEIRVIPPKKDQKDITYGAYAILDEDIDSIVRYSEPNVPEPVVAVVPQVENTILAPRDGTTIDNIAEAARQREAALANNFVNDDALFLPSDGSSSDANLFGDEPLSLKDLSTLSINKSLAWVSQDLKMQFSSLGGSGLFVDDEKMVEDAKVFFHPAKGLIVVALPNNEFKYYRPIITDVYPVLEDALYSDLNIKYTDVDQDKIARFAEEIPGTAGSTNYFLYPGLTIGTFALFLLILL